MKKAGKFLMTFALLAFIANILGSACGQITVGAPISFDSYEVFIRFITCGIFALIGIALYFIEKVKPMKKPKPVCIDQDGGWRCPNCGYNNLGCSVCENCKYESIFANEYDNRKESNNKFGRQDQEYHSVDYYEVLEVSKNASSETIKAAYRAMCKKYHPETCQDGLFDDQKILLINQAYEILSDPEKRKKYDEQYSSSFIQSDHKKHETKKHRIRKLVSITIPVFLVIIVSVVYFVGEHNKKEEAQSQVMQNSNIYLLITPENSSESYYCKANVHENNGIKKITKLLMCTGKSFEVDIPMLDEGEEKDVELKCKVTDTVDRFNVTIKLVSKDLAKNDLLLETEKQLESKSPTSQTFYYATKGSRTCHASTCESLFPSKDVLYFTCKKSAALMGYTSTCIICKDYKPITFDEIKDYVFSNE